MKQKPTQMKANMTHSAKADEAEPLVTRDGREGTDPILIAESDDTPYQLYSAPRWNKDIGLVENMYEVVNTTTNVIESRLRVNFVTAMSVYETIVDLYREFQEAGSVKAMDQNDASVPSVGNVSAKTH